MKAIRFDKYGDVSELYVADVPVPEPADDGVVVQVKAAGINPGEASIRSGALANMFPTTFPSGEGTDFAGVISAVGAAVTDYSVGDEVAGYTHNRASHAEYVAVAKDHVVAKPANVSWKVAGSLWVAGMTANAAVRAVTLQAGDMVVIAGAAGGVGSIAVQYAKQTGATVYGIAGGHDREWLESKGVEYIDYSVAVRQDIAGRIGVPDAFIDLSGKGYVKMAIDLGVAKDRINTVIDFAAASEHGVKTDGSAAISDIAELAKLLQLIGDGTFEIPIAKAFALQDVRQAYDYLASSHHRGKVVLLP